MDYVKLGHTGIDVSVHALGCWPFAGGQVWGEQGDDDSIATVHAALDAGINFFDTAEGYGKGHSEVVLGRGLESQRDQAVIATKVSPSNLAPNDISAACERSLRHLNTDYIDLYQIHWPNHDVPLADSLGALGRLKEQGKIRAIGVCNFGPLDLNDLLDIGQTESDQLPYGMLWRPIEHEIQPKCVENGIGIICYSPLSQGLLTGRYATANDVPDGLARSRHFSNDRPQSIHGEEGCEEELFEAIDRVRTIADELGLTMATVALAWARQQLGVTSLLVGARNTHELHLNLAAVDLLLPEDALGHLTDATESVKYYLGANPDMWHTPSRMR